MFEEKNYPALMLISKIYKGLAYIAFFIGIIALIYAIVTIITFTVATIVSLSILLGCIFIGILFLAISEIIILFINIEENTRK